MTAPINVPDTRYEIGQITRTVNAMHGALICLWLATLLIGVALLVWVFVLGDNVGVRASIVEGLWPLLAAWVTGLYFWGRNVASQARELVRADTIVSMAERNTLRRAAVGVPAVPVP